MREVQGTTWVFQLIIIFILIFACFLTLVLNYSKAYKVKNEMLSIIEKYEGVNSTSLDTMNNYLRETGYKTTGKCPEDYYGAVDLFGNIEKSDGTKNYFYCFQEDGSDKNIYYNVNVFYRFNLPVLGDLTVFKVHGRTNSFIGTNDRF